MLFTLRTGNVGTHKHQVSFPGGHIDGAETAEEAAVRECNEELGGGGSVTWRPLGRYHDILAGK